MMTLDKQQRDRLINVITHYFIDHPYAADSVEGIMQWWLPQQKGKTEMIDKSDLQEILDYLIEANVITRTALPGGQMLYTRSDKKSD